MPAALRRSALPGAVAALVLLAACTGGSSAPGTSAPASLASVSPRPEGLSYAFRYEGEIRDGVVVDSSGQNNPGIIRTGSGGTVTSQRDDTATDPQSAQFLRFPNEACALASGCPQAVVETTRPVNPGSGGSAPFRFGARVQLHGGPQPGENVLERGRAITGTPQWKLQVDHGEASCRWSDGRTVLLLPNDAGGARLPLAQDRWYAVECERRAGGTFSITVFDASGRPEGRFTKTVPELGAILPEGPVTVGGKRIGGADDQTDQFRGDLDDIWFHTD